MLKKVLKFRTETILPLLGDDSYALFAKAVLFGRAQGSVYLDDDRCPKVAAILSAEEERCYFTLRSCDGNAEAWATALTETVLRDQHEENGAHIEFFLSPEADGSVRALFDGMKACWNPAFLYSWHAGRIIDPPVTVPEGFFLQAITAEFLASEGIENLDLILDEWDERDDGVDGVRGFCLLSGSMVAAVCHVDFRCGDAVELGVITDPAFRRKGLAAAAAGNAIRYFIERGIKHVVWHAPVDYKGSCSTASRCGLTIERGFGEYLLHYKLGYRKLMLGYRDVRLGNLAGAASLYRQALKLEKDEAKPFAGAHERFEVASWILECYCALKDESALEDVLREFPLHGVLLTPERILVLEQEGDCRFLAQCEAWKSFKADS